MNSKNWPASSVWVFIAQLVEHCSVNVEAMGSNFFIGRATSQLHKLRFNCDGHIFISPFIKRAVYSQADTSIKRAERSVLNVLSYSVLNGHCNEILTNENEIQISFDQFGTSDPY